MIPYFVPKHVDADSRYIYDAFVYIWPDGDRTLVREDSPQAMLNDKPADFYWSGDGRFLCQSNPDTGNKFCASHDDDESDEG